MVPWLSDRRACSLSRDISSSQPYPVHQSHTSASTCRPHKEFCQVGERDFPSHNTLPQSFPSDHQTHVQDSCILPVGRHVPWPHHPPLSLPHPRRLQEHSWSSATGLQNFPVPGADEVGQHFLLQLFSCLTPYRQGSNWLLRLSC